MGILVKFSKTAGVVEQAGKIQLAGAKIVSMKFVGGVRIWEIDGPGAAALAAELSSDGDVEKRALGPIEMPVTVRPLTLEEFAQRQAEIDAMPVDALSLGRAERIIALIRRRPPPPEPGVVILPMTVLGCRHRAARMQAAL